MSNSLFRLLSLGGNLVSHLIGKMKGTEKEKTYGKLATFFIGSLTKPGGAKKLGEELYSQAREARPERVRVQTPRLDPKLNQIERELKRGGSEA